MNGEKIKRRSSGGPPRDRPKPWARGRRRPPPSTSCSDDDSDREDNGKLGRRSGRRTYPAGRSISRRKPNHLSASRLLNELYQERQMELRKQLMEVERDCSAEFQSGLSKLCRQFRTDMMGIESKREYDEWVSKLSYEKECSDAMQQFMEKRQQLLNDLMAKKSKNRQRLLSDSRNLQQLYGEDDDDDSDENLVGIGRRILRPRSRSNSESKIIDSPSTCDSSQGKEDDPSNRDVKFLLSDEEVEYDLAEIKKKPKTYRGFEPVQWTVSNSAT